MKTLLTIFFLLCTHSIFAQHNADDANWNDTTFIQIPLKDSLLSKQVIKITVGKKAIIYLDKNSFVVSASSWANDANKDEIAQLLAIIEAKALTADTIPLKDDVAYTDYIIAEQLQLGNAGVYYNKEHQFVSSISQRVEKYGMYAHRFFYLPDGRPFYSVMVASGILEDGKMFSDPNELMQYAEKQGSLLKP